MVAIKVLNINKFFYIKGGSETYYFSLKELLTRNGHEVIDFSMKHEENFQSAYMEYFVKEINYNAFNNIFNKIKLSAKIIYSLEAKRKIGSLIKKYKPDIAHLHIFQHQLSPSILYELKNHGIPVVYTVHDLKSMCPNYKMLNHGKICEACKGSQYFRCLSNKCIKDSYTKSFVSTMEMYIHNILRVYDLVDIFIPPSRFYSEKLVEFGFDLKKIVYNPNFLDINTFQPNYDYKNYFVYFGRLSEEKGIYTLIKAMKQIEASSELWIIGTGPEEQGIKDFIGKNGLQEKIKVLGFKGGIELHDLIKNSMFGIVPSEWYENAPYSLLEMMAFGKPVIGARIGGITELIEDNQTGLLFPSGDEAILAQKINTLLGDRDKITNYGKKARKKLEMEFNSEIHYQILSGIYQRLVNKS